MDVRTFRALWYRLRILVIQQRIRPQGPFFSWVGKFHGSCADILILRKSREIVWARKNYKFLVFFLSILGIYIIFLIDFRLKQNITKK